MTINVNAIEFPNATEAIQHMNADGRGVAVQVDRKSLVMSQVDADRMAAAGVEFAYLCDHELPDGTSRIVTIPVN